MLIILVHWYACLFYVIGDIEGKENKWYTADNYNIE